MDKLENLIKETKIDRQWYKDRRLFIEAAACAVRQKALEDAREAVRIELRPR
jgi:hypothetical protein